VTGCVCVGGGGGDECAGGCAVVGGYEYEYEKSGAENTSRECIVLDLRAANTMQRCEEE
jgi:hypothetical protein